MTTDDFGTVDIDLLADYIGGALDGPGQAQVERLIADDPQWQATYEMLAPGMVAAGAELAGLGAQAVPMPADVIARLDAAFAAPAAAAATTIPADLAAPTEPHLTPTTDDSVPASERHLSLVPSSDTTTGRVTTTTVARKRRRRLKWAVPIAAAAGVIAFAGFGASYLAESTQTSADNASSAAGGAEQAAPMMGSGSDSRAVGGLVILPPADEIVATGRNYTGAALLENAEASKSSQSYYGPDALSDPSAPARAAIAMDPELAALQRLQPPDALLDCLTAVAEQNGGPIEVRSVDYARFQGAPAVIVRFTFDGLPKGWAVGPECGTPTAGADKL